MIRYINPTAVRHQGRGLLIAEKIETDDATGDENRSLVYNILALNPDVTDDGLGWQGFNPLPADPAQQTSLAGYSVLRVLGVQPTTGPVLAVSDETHIYLFRPDGHTLLVERFLLVETADPKARDGRGYALVADWEVRFRRSGSADLPASANDVSAYKNPDGAPFLDPRRYLSLAPGEDVLDLSLGFSAVLLPSAEPGRLQWRLFARSLDGTTLYSYSVPRLADGWFDLEATDRDQEGRILPVSSFKPRLDQDGGETAMLLTGHPAGALYQRLEPMVDTQGGSVQMRTANRLFLSSPAALVPPAEAEADAPAGTAAEARLLTLDFQVEPDGDIAFDGATAQPVSVGETGPAALSVDFPLPSLATIAKPVPGSAAFTVQLWLCPQRGPVGADEAGKPRAILGQSGNVPPEQRGVSLEIVDQFRIRIAFGTGAGVVAAVTSANVLSYGTWVNVSITCDGTTLAFFLNGAEVPLAVTGALGPAPSGVIDRIGAHEGGFVGQLTETRIWSVALSQAQIRENILAPLPDPKVAGLVAYWPMDGGVGTDIVDLTGNGHDAVMVGSVWFEDTAPMARPDQSINQIDTQNRNLVAGWLKPSQAFPAFGAVQAKSRPSVLPTGDGPIHLYYPGPDRRFTVARRAALAQRAFFTDGWSAKDSGGGVVETGSIVFITRQTGAYNSFTAIDVKAGHSGIVCNVELDGPSIDSGFDAAMLRRFVRLEAGTQERWAGVPRRLGFFDQVLNGRAVPDPADPRVSDGRSVFYDYSGERAQALLTLGDEAVLAGLRFVTTVPAAFPLAKVTGVAESEDLAITLRFDHPKGKSVVARFGAVPRVAEAVIELLLGRAADAAYAPSDSSTPTWGLPARFTHLFVLAPRFEDGKPVVQSAVFTLSAGSTLETATFTAELTLAGSALSATWQDVPREGAAFIAAVEAGTTPEQKAVLKEIIFLDRTLGTPLNADEVKVEVKSDLRYVTALVAAFREGQGGALPATFDLAASRLQGVTGARIHLDGTAASALVSVEALTLPSSGFPAAIDFGNTLSGTILLAIPGRDGGWLRDPPRFAQHFDGNGALSVDLAALVPAPDVYEIPGAVTIEAWVQPDESQRDPGFSSETLQSVLHFSAAEDGLSYGLAFAPVETPRFFEQVQFTISDATVPADSPDDKLVRDGKYTVQLYLRPSLIAAGTNWFWKRQAPDGTGSAELLSIRIPAAEAEAEAEEDVAAKPANWRLVFTAGTEEMVAPNVIPGDRWTLVTLVRNGASATLYVDGEEAMNRSDIAQPTLAASRYTVANPLGNVLFEFDPNEFAAWNLARSAQRVRETFLRPLTGSETGLVAFFPMSHKEPSFQLTNRARWTTTIYNTSFTGNPFFTKTGLFFDVVANYGARANASGTPALAPRRWLHIAAVLNRRGALAPGGTQSASASGQKETRIGKGFALDARVRLNRLGGRQVVISRFATDAEAQLYELGVRSEGRAYVTVRLRPVAGRLSSPDAGLVTILAAPDRPVGPGAPHHLCASLSLVSVTDSASRSDVTALAGEVYVDGVGNASVAQPAGTDLAAYKLVTVIGGTGTGYYKSGTTVTIETSDPAHFTRWYGTMSGLGDGFDPAKPKTSFKMPAGDDFVDRTLAARVFVDPVEFANPATATRAGASGAGLASSGFFDGQISDLRQWSEALGPAEVAELTAQPGASPFDDKLISWWQFAEQSGRLAKDSVNGNDLTLTSSTIWAWFDRADVTFYVDGLAVPVVGLPPSPLGATPRQLRIGGVVLKATGQFGTGLKGQIDELRLWKGQRSREQILINMNRYLTGAEPGLVGYWRFDAGSGDLVADRTVHRGDGRYFNASGQPAAIDWTHSSAPIGFDAPVVNDALDVRQSPEAVELATEPAATAVFEYGDTLALLDGTVQGVLKRSYVFDGISGLDDDTGYKVGDLVRIYIGQIQTDPTVIGYIEGAPPLPSENLTRPLTDASSVDTYDGIASVTLTDETEQKVQIGTGDESSDKDQFKISIGGALSGNKEEVIGIPPYQTTIQSVTWTGKLGGLISGSFESKSGSEDAFDAAAQRGITYAMANGGLWEQKSPDGTYFLESGERRFVPTNVGTAIVKSQVADLYALQVPSTGALVSLSAEPNPDIPLDVNIIRFPIDPIYQLAGCLDGRIGLQKAPMTETSYFKPREAYTLKREVERQRQALAAFYAQTELKTLLGQPDLSSVQRASPVFTADLSVPVRDMVNTYVWSSGGGTYAESEGFSTEIGETYTLGRSREFGVGVNISLFFAIFSGGVTIEAEYQHLFGRSYKTNKSLARSRALKLEIEAAPDSFMFKYHEDGDFGPDPVPGKVEGYRFMTFYLANRSENAARLFNEVIDQAWLHSSQAPDAAAMREAKARSADMAPWRVLHRVTFVSRVPPRFQAVPDLTDRTAVPEAPNQAQNAVFLALVKAKIPAVPSPADISAAVQAVLTSDLVGLLPWWSAFLAAAKTPNSPEQQELRRITSDSIAYALSVFGAH